MEEALFADPVSSMHLLSCICLNSIIVSMMNMDYEFPSQLKADIILVGNCQSWKILSGGECPFSIRCA